jgi:mRNA-degrading endonuclease toxin of MazEF toxin-antitoxin module
VSREQAWEIGGPPEAAASGHALTGTGADRPGDDPTVTAALPANRTAMNTDDVEILTEWTEADVESIIARQFEAITMAEREAARAPRHVRAGQVYIVARALRRRGRPRRALPVLVVQNNMLNMLEPTTMVVRLTTRPPARWRDHSVSLRAAETGLRKDAVALCHQAMTILQTDCKRLVGTISPPSLRRVTAVLRCCLDPRFP